MTNEEKAIYEKGLLDSELIFALKKKEAELRKESEECTEKIKKWNYPDLPLIEWCQKRAYLDDAIYHAYGLIQFLTKK